MCCHYVIFKPCFPGENKHAMPSLRQLDWMVSQEVRNTYFTAVHTVSILMLTKHLLCYCVHTQWPESDPRNAEVHEKSGMIYSRQMQRVCDTSFRPQRKCPRWSFEYQVQKSPWIPTLELDSIKYTQSSQKVPAWLAGSIRNIYRTDILTTINDNWLPLFECGGRNGTARWEKNYSMLIRPSVSSLCTEIRLL